jgi:hypothetical protein
MRVSPSLRPLPALSLAGALILTACSNTKTAFDPVALSQSTDVVIATMDSSPAMQSMSVLGEKMTTNAPAMGAASFLAATATRLPVTGPGFPTWAAAQLAAFQQAVPALSVTAPNAVILPELILGTTFTYDLATGHYKVSNLTGAPSTGVRFILYQVHAVTADSLALVEPLTSIGCADLTDESASVSALKLHLKAYSTGNACTTLNTPLIDYTASASITGTPPNVTAAQVDVSGFVSDGTTQVDFDLSQTLSTTTGITVDYSLSVPSADVSVGFKATYTLAQQATVTLTVQNAGNTTVVNASGNEAAITGTIKHNGDLVVNIVGSPSSPTFTSASGDALTDAQVAALRRMFDFTDELLNHVDEMLAPAHALLGLSLVFA